MSEEQPKIYTPAQAAKMLGITIYKLQYLRARGRIEGMDIGNSTIYTEEQIKAADLAPRKTGRPKGEKKGLDEDDSSSVMLKGCSIIACLVGSGGGARDDA